MLLSDRVAIITGGAKGIGRATALKFADEGCSVIIADVLEDRGKQTADEVSQKEVKGLAITCDVTNGQQVHDMVAQVIDKFGKIDILVNDAGAMFGTVPAEKETEDHWEQVFNLNLKSDYLCIKEVIPHMKARKYGKIVNLSSIGAVYPPGPSMAYASAKAGVLGLTRALAMELGPFNITINGGVILLLESPSLVSLLEFQSPSFIIFLWLPLIIILCYYRVHKKHSILDFS